MLVAESPSHPNLYMKFDHASCYRIEKIRRALPDTFKRHILAAHALTGCDTVSALFNKGKRQVFSVLSQAGDHSYLEAFQDNQVTPEQIAEAGE